MVSGMGWRTNPDTRAAAGLRPAWLATLVALLIASATAVAGPEFVADASITESGQSVRLAIRLACAVQYLGHQPANRGDRLLIELEPTAICSGVPPTAARSRVQVRPRGADAARLASVEYDGESGAGAFLRLQFSERVHFTLPPSPDANTVIVLIHPSDSPDADVAPVGAETGTGRISHRVGDAGADVPSYVINLLSDRQPPLVPAPDALSIPAERTLFVSETVVGGETWYRLQLGWFDSVDAATSVAASLRETYPRAWVGRASAGAVTTTVAEPDGTATAPPGATAAHIEDIGVESDIAQLMAEAKRAMTAGDTDRAIRLYTKVLRQPASPWHPDAREFLAVARERKGQIAHAKAEYEQYLAIWPEGEGAERVRQRLAALIAAAVAPASGNPGLAAAERTARRDRSPWTLRTLLSQYYRRDANQINDNAEVLSQSAVYTDASLDARRRGQRYDFSSRVTAGYRHDLLDEPAGSGNDLRLSYAYADLADTAWGLQGRFGRQSRNTGGVQGRFDGFNLGYRATERMLVEGVVGKPVYSTADGLDDARTFYGVSTTIGPIAEDVDIGLYFLQQDIEGITDRQVLGGEARYFAENGSVWGRVDYDTAFAELSSVFLQASWRLPGRFTASGLVDRRRSPFLSMGSAMAGQPVDEFASLLPLFTEDELRQLALDRSAISTTTTLGLSGPVSPRLQINLNASRTAVDETPDSGGVLGQPSSTYSYYSTDLIASGLLRPNDVSIIGVRYADSTNTQVWSLNLDARFAIGRSLRLNPRLRIDHRSIRSDGSDEWIYSPGLRLQYRWGRNARLHLEAGRQIASRALETIDLDRDSYFLNLGYQLFY